MRDQWGTFSESTSILTPTSALVDAHFLLDTKVLNDFPQTTLMEASLAEPWQQWFGLT